jgi:hypothetical protein
MKEDWWGGISILIYELNKDKNKILRNIYLLAKSIEAPKKKNQNSVVAKYHSLQHCDQCWASTYFGREKSSISFSIQRTQTGT